MNLTKTALVRSNNLLPLISTTTIDFDDLVEMCKQAGYSEIECNENDIERVWCGSSYVGSEQFLIMHWQRKEV